ncbi:MAG: hypothetical protein L6Q84_34905 [Polyangiaceae bacterium]|nr:hypothetical protein [Polyangiaceae bacterium]
MRGSVASEFQGAELGDRRLTTRLERIVQAADANPSESFPDMMGSDAELEGFYRFIRNDKVDFEEVLRPHVRATVARMGEHREVLVVHDTTEFRFLGNKRKGLGRVGSAGQGFLGHFSLAVVPGEAREPLGLLVVQPWTRQGKSVSKREKEGLLSKAEARRTPGRESERYCTDLLTDPLNCGSCRRTCSGAAPQCDQGQCVCKGAVCLGVCKDTQTDPTNCGDCGVFCSLTGVCAGGKCTTACTGTPTPCDQFDPNDCGFTQWGCKAQELCVGGAFSCATFDHACTACNVQAGCSCESGTGLCKGSTSCEAQSIFSCKPYAGCSLVKKCLGTPPACETRSAKDCKSVQGCTLP